MDSVEHYTENHDLYVKYCSNDVLEAACPFVPVYLFDFVAEKLGLEKGDSLLDLGGGLGYPAYYFSDKHGCNVKSYNNCPIQLKHAREKYGQVEYIYDDFNSENPQYTSFKFDAAIMLEALGHVKNLCEFFKKIPANKIFITHTESGAEKTREIIENFYAYDEYPPEEIYDSLLRAGFELEDFGVIPFTPYVNVPILNEFRANMEAAGKDMPAVQVVGYYFLAKRI